MRNTKKYYSIGQAGKLCNIPSYTLRFYDKIGLIPADKIGENNYRFYNKATLNYIPVIKYYKQMGFSIEEMKTIVNNNSLSLHEKLFKEKIEFLKKDKKNIYKKYRAIEGWLQQITEAEIIRKNDVREISIKYVEPSLFCCLEQNFNYNYKESIINIDFTNYMEALGNKAIGLIILNFHNSKLKLQGDKTKFTIMQQSILNVSPKTKTKVFGGHIFVSCYHLGSHKTIGTTYIKIYEWAAKNNYICGKESYERCLIDYWTTQNSNDFVTEVLIRTEKNI